MMYKTLFIKNQNWLEDYQNEAYKCRSMNGLIPITFLSKYHFFFQYNFCSSRKKFADPITETVLNFVKLLSTEARYRKEKIQTHMITFMLLLFIQKYSLTKYIQIDAKTFVPYALSFSLFLSWTRCLCVCQMNLIGCHFPIGCFYLDICIYPYMEQKMHVFLETENSIPLSKRYFWIKFSLRWVHPISSEFLSTTYFIRLWHSCCLYFWKEFQWIKKHLLVCIYLPFFN